MSPYSVCPQEPHLRHHHLTGTIVGYETKENMPSTQQKISSGVGGVLPHGGLRYGDLVA